MFRKLWVIQQVKCILYPILINDSHFGSHQWLSKKLFFLTRPFFLQNSSFSNKLPLLKSPPPPVMSPPSLGSPTLYWIACLESPLPSSEPPSLKAPLSKKPPSLKCSPLSPFPWAPKPLKILNCKVYSEHYPYSEPCELHESRMQFTPYIKVQMGWKDLPTELQYWKVL